MFDSGRQDFGSFQQICRVCPVLEMFTAAVGGCADFRLFGHFTLGPNGLLL